MSSEINISGYQILSELGRGGMATVYLAKQISLDRQVALKIFKEELAKDADNKQRFLDEGKMAGSLSHKNILQIFDTAVSGDHYYISMEYVSGGTLKEKITASKKGLDPSQVVSIVLHMADALAYAHKKGIVHRDIKPENILFREGGSPVISDFGIAKNLTTDANLTNSGMFMGTPYYTSPEQFDGKATPQSDLYSLGIVFYEMLTKQRPFQAKESLALALQHASDPIPKLPTELKLYQPIIEKLCAKKPEHRHQSAQELLEDLQQISRPDTARIRDQAKQKKRNRRIAGIATILVLINIIAWSYFYFYQSDQTDSVADVNNTGNTSNTISPEKAKIQRLLNTANMHLEIGNLIEPEGFNAYYAFNQVLEIEANNDLANAGLDEIVKVLTQQAEEALAENDLDRGAKLVKKALTIRPDDNRLLDLKSRI